MKLEKLLDKVASVVKHPGGELCWFNPDLDYPLVDAVDGSEMQAYIDYQLADHLIVQQGAGLQGGYRPTKAGWLACEPRLVRGGTPGRCFVAMPFRKDLEEAYDFGFEPAIKDAGFSPIRIDREYPITGIYDRTIAEVRMAQFVVVDFTDHRPSVYYEAGFAHGIGRDVICTCREDSKAGLHFNVRHLGQIIWKDVADLKAALTASIRANVLSKG